MIQSFIQFDHLLFHFINHTMANPVFDVVCSAFRGQMFLVFFYVLMAIVIFKKEPKHFVRIVAFASITFLLTDQLSASVIKQLFQRVRPCNNAAEQARLVIEHCGSGYSFVSAHAANSFGIATFISSIAQVRLRVTVFLFTWAVLVSFSQVYVGVHYPFDVAAGAVLGISIGKAIDHVGNISFVKEQFDRINFLNK